VWRWSLFAVLGVLGGSVGAADPPGTPASRAALERCKGADAQAAPERTAALRESLALAERAIAADERDAIAHFAVFCAVGGLLESEGVWFSAPRRLRLLRREVDRTLELAPDFSDALAGKGTLLLKLPRLFGGDATEAERLLRRALEVDPDYLRPRLALVDALRERGAVEEARAEAVRALAIAEQKGDVDDARAARAHVEALGGGATNP
jgi:tetratricopeptide (TPR) repeat protein